MPHESGGFAILGGTDIITPYMWVPDTVLANPFGWFIPQSQAISLYAWAEKDSA